MAKQIFVNLPVKDLNKAKEFFSKLGFTFNPQFTDQNAACMVIGENICAMLLVEKFFKTFTAGKEISDAKKSTEVLNALSVDGRAAVDEMIEKAVEAGGREFRKAQDHGRMYGRAFEDLDGHIWEVFYMDEEVMPEEMNKKNLGGEKMNRVIHFEIQAANPERAAKFYRDIFGWEIKEWIVPGVQMKDENRYWLVMTAPEGSKEPGINGGILFRRGGTPADDRCVNAYVCTIGVSSVDEFVEKITKAGGTIAVPKMAIPGVGWLVYLKDLDSNIFGIMQNDKNAK